MTTRQMQIELENRLYVVDPSYRARKLYSREILNYLQRAFHQVFDAYM